MAPTLPSFLPARARGRGHCAAAAITISSSSSPSFSSGSDQSVTNNTLNVLSSSTSSGSSRSQGRGGQSSAPRLRPPPSLAARRPPSLVPTAASAANGSGHVAASWEETTAPPDHQCPSPRSVLSGRAPGGVAQGSLSSSDDDDEATSRPNTRVRYRKWQLQDELKVLATLAELRRDNLGVLPQVSVLLTKICASGGLSRRGVDAAELSGKVYQLKKKFKRTAARVAATGRRIRRYRNQVLYRSSKEVWPHVLLAHHGAAVLGTRAARR